MIVSLLRDFWQDFKSDWAILPNVITLIRLALSIFLFYLLVHNGPGVWLFALSLFTFIALTDTLDGYLARKMRMITRLGAILDPAVDYIFIGSSLIALNFVNPYRSLLVPTAIMFLVELAICLIVLRAKSRGETVSTIFSGKVKMWGQCIAAGFQILSLGGSWQNVANDVTFIAVGMTIITAVDYLYKHELDMKYNNVVS